MRRNHQVKVENISSKNAWIILVENKISLTSLTLNLLLLTHYNLNMAVTEIGEAIGKI
jgi:hypothetical protein